MNKKEILQQVVRGEHPNPLEALIDLYKNGLITLDEVQYRIPLPPKLRWMFRDSVTLDEVLTSAEASEMWGLNDSTLRKAFTNNDKRFKEGEFRKSGKVWLVKKDAMERVYGKLEDKKSD